MTFRNPPDRLLEHLIRQYDLGVMKFCSSIEAGPLSTAFKVEAGGRLYCLKRHREEKSVEQLEREERLLVCLNEHGFSLAPVLIPAKDGSGHVRLEEGRWSLYAFVEADPPFNWTVPAWCSGHCLSAGSALAKLHFFGRRCTCSIRAHDDAAKDGASTHESLVSYVDSGLASHFRAQGPLLAHPGINREVLLSGAEATGGAVKLMRERDEPALTHGDFHPGNVLFLGQEAVVILDFDYARIDSPAFDLGYAALFFCARWSDDAGKDGTLDGRLFEALLAGYVTTAGRLGLQSRLLPGLDGAEAAAAALNSCMRLSCYLAIGWLLHGLSPDAAGRPSPMLRALEHMLRALAVLEA